MDQPTHAWIALRAIALLDAEKKSKNLVALLKPHAKKAAIGAWLPDKADMKPGASTDNHILKMQPMTRDKAGRFAVKKKDLLKLLGPQRKVHAFLTDNESLDDVWWQASYKAEPRPGQHLANRAMALSTTIVDQLLLGDTEVDSLTHKSVKFKGCLDPKSRTNEAQIALYFAMLSHFVADACMPCHCDKRDLADYGNGLHKEIEKHLAKLVGPTFEADNLDALKCSADALIDKAVDVDQVAGLAFEEKIPDIVSTDVWKEVIYLCRASFAVASIIAPPDQYPYGVEKKQAPFKDVFPKGNGDLWTGFSAMTLHDAVLNVAMVWKHAWNHAIGKGKN
jgi:hypothetical protein